ncbi:nitric oxide-associated protein 1 [Alligator mississippiensis]|uniref:nitric oxide-associated protein 1 n=1 Tax=Alligator mississippiensis TaxID=8496 RepID=UPI002877C31B|nr:nitric oxide-associated protein 1 [Alligator mississippiensis]
MHRLCLRRLLVAGAQARARALGTPFKLRPGLRCQPLPAGLASVPWDLLGPGSNEEELFVFPEYLPEELEKPWGTEVVPKKPPRERRCQERRQHRPKGQPDPSMPTSSVSCSGCGAELHCQDPAMPGYMPSEKYLSLLGEPEGQGGLRGAVCQRCWLLVHHQQALRLEVSRDQYRSLVSTALRQLPRHGRAPLVLYVADVLDLPDTLLPDLPELLGPTINIMVLGNKVDLLPPDSHDYLKRFRKQLLLNCAQAGIHPVTKGIRGSAGRQHLVDIHLISAKTGYGVEELISKLQGSWKCNGDVYLVGATNSGKSTLFNTLLQSDYCKSRASEVVNRATVSPWPGTTLNLLKFPLINPTSDRIFRRKERLKAEAEKDEEQLSRDEKKTLNYFKKQGYLIGRIGRTFQQQKAEPVIDFDPDTLSFTMEEEPVVSIYKPKEREEFTYNEVKDARWCFDTPGIVKENCVLNLLTEKEVKLVLPSKAIVPRTFVLKPGMVLFLGALGRIDYLQGEQSSWFSVMASHLLPVHVTFLEKADVIYQKHSGNDLLKVPMGGEERMKEFPPLVPQDIMLEGIGADEAVADIKLSSAGWVAVTAQLEDKVHLRAYVPEGTGLTVRRPPLLPYIVHIKGKRIKGSVAYRTKKLPPLVENLKRTNQQKKRTSDL